MGVIHDSGLIYNDEHHANIGVAKFMGLQDEGMANPSKEATSARTSTAVLGRKAMAYAGVGHEIGVRT